MPQAIELRQRNLMLISTKTEVPVADLQAMLENWEEFESDPNNPLMIVIDFTAPDGTYVPWSEMSKKYFRDNFRFVWLTRPNKFRPVVSIF